MAGEVPLVGPDGLPRENAFARLELEHLVDQQERLPVRQDRLDLLAAQSVVLTPLRFSKAAARKPARARCA